MLRVQEGDGAAFDALVRRWEHRLLNLIYRIIGDFEVAQDVRQEVFLRVYQAAQRYQPISSFQTWIFRVAINCSISELRKRKRRRMVSLHVSWEQKDGESQALEETLVDANPQQDVLLQQRERDQILQKALDRLPQEQRLVIILRHYEGLKFREIAAILDCPVSTVKSRMRYGLGQLQTMLRHLS